MNLKESMNNPDIHKILLIKRYDWDTVRKTIDKKLSEINFLDQIQLQDKLSNIFYWEYEKQ